MRSKISQLLLVFLFTGLLVSSKQSFSIKKDCCELRCLPQKKEIIPVAEKSQPVKTDYPFALAPGSYIFFY